MALVSRKSFTLRHFNKLSDEFRYQRYFLFSFEF